MRDETGRITALDPLFGAAKNFVNTKIAPRVFDTSGKTPRIKVLDPVADYFTQPAIKSPVAGSPQPTQFSQDVTSVLKMFQRQPQTAAAQQPQVGYVQSQESKRSPIQPQVPQRVPQSYPFSGAPQEAPQSPSNGIVQMLIQMLSRPTATPMPTATPTPTSGPKKPTREDYIRAMQSVIPELGQNTPLPVGQYADYIYDTTSKYPIFQKYPFLPIAQSILESSGFQNYSEPKRALGFAPYVKTYNPTDLRQVILDYASAIGGRNQSEEQVNYPNEWRSRMSTSSNYEPFRQSGDLSALANIYAPESDNQGTGGNIYAQRLQWIMDRYQDALNKSLEQKK